MISILIEYYIKSFITSPQNTNVNSNSKSIIDLISCVPDCIVKLFIYLTLKNVKKYLIIFCIKKKKLFDEINKFMSKLPMQNHSNSSQTMNTNYFERLLNLLVLLVDRNKQFRFKLINHQLITNILKNITKVL